MLDETAAAAADDTAAATAGVDVAAGVGGALCNCAEADNVFEDED